MVAPDVARKLHNHDFSISPSNRGQKEAYRMEAACIIYIKWWIKNNERPILLAVPAPSFPWFHPKDCQALRDRVGLPCDVYEYLQLSTPIEFTLEEDDSWILTPGPIRVKPDITLYLRSPNVTVCSELRGGSHSQKHKRALSIEPPSTPTPITRNKNTRSTSPGPSTKKSKIVILNPPLSLADAPAGRRSAWPLLFACDMDMGFKKIAAMPGTPASNFTAVFGSEWHSSTFSESFRAWRNAPKPGLAAAIRCGRASGGEWAPIAKMYGRKKLMPRTVLTSQYLESQKGLTVQRLRAILRIQRQVTSLPTVPATKPAARRLILSARTSVDWISVCGDQPCTYAIDDHFRGLLKAKVIVVPELEDKTGYESDLTATPEDLKNYTPLPATEEAGLITMDVDVQGEDRMDVDSDAEEQSLKQEDNPKQFERQSWGEPEEFDPQFWGLIARTSDDKPGAVKLIILNYARDGDKAQGYFHPAIFDPEEYGPDGSGRLYLDTETVFKSLDDLGALPDAPWLCKWALPGYPWTIGPIAFQRSAEVPAQLDVSQRRLEAIPVNGAPDALRAMLCFGVIPETELASPLAGTHVEADIKEELDVKPDVKLSARAKGQSDAAKAKNSAMVAYLEKRLLNYPGVKAIRDAPRVRGSHPVPTVVAWVHTVASLVNAYKKCMDRTYGDAFNKAITYDNWGKLFNRAAGWVTSCVLAEPYIRSCASQADVEKLLADESLSVGVPSLIQLIETKAFLSYNEFLEAKVPEE
ncbi:hypothetical protein DFH09DRAFT_1282210 [Mycena vulgaris]|nr:hypothetical protein DFH09DRAFT_1282210 [Mycena vulgaris]